MSEPLLRPQRDAYCNEVIEAVRRSAPDELVSLGLSEMMMQHAFEAGWRRALMQCEKRLDAVRKDPTLYGEETEA